MESMLDLECGKDGMILCYRETVANVSSVSINTVDLGVVIH